VADAVEAMWQDMEQEAADELVRRECHDRSMVNKLAQQSSLNQDLDLKSMTHS
jgi:hypothetical protein